MTAIGATPSRLDTPANVSSLNLLRTLPGRWWRGSPCPKPDRPQRLVFAIPRVSSGAVTLAEIAVRLRMLGSPALGAGDMIGRASKADWEARCRCKAARVPRHSQQQVRPSPCCRASPARLAFKTLPPHIPGASISTGRSEPWKPRKSGILEPLNGTPAVRAKPRHRGGGRGHARAGSGCPPTSPTPTAPPSPPCWATRSPPTASRCRRASGAADSDGCRSL